MLSGVAWILLWFPSQNVWLKGADFGPTYKGRKALGTVNANISFMTNSIMVVGVPLVIEFASFLYHPNGLNLGWWFLIALPVALFLTIRHIGLACFIFMGIAKLTADSARSGFDEFGLCFGNGW